MSLRSSIRAGPRDVSRLDKHLEGVLPTPLQGLARTDVFLMLIGPSASYNLALYYILLYCIISILYYTILYYTILYYTILYYTILYYTILYYTILYYTI